MLKKSDLLIFTAGILLLSGCKNYSSSLLEAITGETVSMVTDGNSLYHQTDEKQLTVSKISILGEVDNLVKVDLTSYYKREVF